MSDRTFVEAELGKEENYLQQKTERREEGKQEKWAVPLNMRIKRFAVGLTFCNTPGTLYTTSFPGYPCIFSSLYLQTQNGRDS